MADVHRKIELQEQDDLLYLVNNARRRANERIDLALPPIEGEDALRQRVEELVHSVSTLPYHLRSLPIFHNFG
jgi:kinetochor protein Mis14/NSL1